MTKDLQTQWFNLIFGLCSMGKWRNNQMLICTWIWAVSILYDCYDAFHAHSKASTTKRPPGAGTVEQWLEPLRAKPASHMRALVQVLATLLLRLLLPFFFLFLFFFLFFFNICFYWKVSLQRKKKQRQSSFVCWFTPQVATMAGAAPIQRSHELLLGLSRGYRDPMTCTILHCFSRSLAGSWIRTGKASSAGQMSIWDASITGSSFIYSYMHI